MASPPADPHLQKCLDENRAHVGEPRIAKSFVGVGGVCCDVDGENDSRTLGGEKFRAVGLIREL